MSIIPTEMKNQIIEEMKREFGKVFRDEDADEILDMLGECILRGRIEGMEAAAREMCYHCRPGAKSFFKTKVQRINGLGMWVHGHIETQAQEACSSTRIWELIRINKS